MAAQVATTITSTNSPSATTSHAGRHPLHNINSAEISAARSILLEALQQRQIDAAAVHFKNVSLHEPPKDLLLPYLDAEAAGVPQSQRPFVPRCIDIIWSTDNERVVRESLISLDAGKEVSVHGPANGQHGSHDR